MSEKIAKTPWNIPYHEVYKVVAAALVIAWQSGPDRYYNLMGADAGLTTSYTGKVKTAAEVPALLRHGNVAHSQRRCSGVFFPSPESRKLVLSTFFPSLSPQVSRDCPLGQHYSCRDSPPFPALLTPAAFTGTEKPFPKRSDAVTGNCRLQIFRGPPFPLLPSLDEKEERKYY